MGFFSKNYAYEDEANAASGPVATTMSDDEVSQHVDTVNDINADEAKINSAISDVAMQEKALDTNIPVVQEFNKKIETEPATVTSATVEAIALSLENLCLILGTAPRALGVHITSENVGATPMFRAIEAVEGLKEIISRIITATYNIIKDVMDWIVRMYAKITNTFQYYFNACDALKNKLNSINSKNDDKVSIPSEEQRNIINKIGNFMVLNNIDAFSNTNVSTLVDRLNGLKTTAELDAMATGFTSLTKYISSATKETLISENNQELFTKITNATSGINKYATGRVVDVLSLLSSNYEDGDDKELQKSIVVITAFNGFKLQLVTVAPNAKHITEEGVFTPEIMTLKMKESVAHKLKVEILSRDSIKTLLTTSKGVIEAKSKYIKDFNDVVTKVSGAVTNLRKIDTLDIDDTDISEAVEKVRYVTKIASIAASSIVAKALLGRVRFIDNVINLCRIQIRMYDEAGKLKKQK